MSRCPYRVPDARWGGAIALGRPIAATVAVITAKCPPEMERAGHELGLVTLCTGGGQGIALLLENEKAGWRRQAVGGHRAGRVASSAP